MRKKTFKVLLKINQLTPKTNLYNAQVQINGNMSTENIISEMLMELPQLKRNEVLDIINRFNNKAIEMLMNGYTVNTGLVNVRPTLKNSLTSKKWNPYTNSVCLSFSESKEAKDAMAKVVVETEEDVPEMVEATDYSFRNKLAMSGIDGGPSITQPDDLSGISAFRNWLMKP